MFWSNKVGLEQEMEEMTGVGKERERANKKKKKKTNYLMPENDKTTNPGMAHK